MNPQDLTQSSEYMHHHTSLARGYVSRKSDGFVRAYKGRFGEGYTIALPNWDSTRYYRLAYYIKGGAA